MNRTGSGEQVDAIPADRLIAFSAAILVDAGADDPTAHDATRAMLHASLHGIDSHGFRLLPHYRAAIQGGRLNGVPDMVFHKTRTGAGTLDADHAHGARAMYQAASHVADLARESGQEIAASAENDIAPTTAAASPMQAVKAKTSAKAKSRAAKKKAAVKTSAGTTAKSAAAKSTATKSAAKSKRQKADPS